MNEIADGAEKKVEADEEREVVELGDVSKETRGSTQGFNYDGGIGWRTIG